MGMAAAMLTNGFAEFLLLTTTLGAGREEAQFVTELRRVPQGWVAVGGLALLAALVWLVVWLYTHEGRIGATLRVRSFLAGLRCTVILLLAVIFLEPVRVKILRRWVDSYTILLLDRSSSMDLVDHYHDEGTAASVRAVLKTTQIQPIRRLDLARQIVLGEDQSFLEGLTRNNRVNVYAFDQEAELLAALRAQREQGASEKTGPSGRAEPGSSASGSAPTAPSPDADAALILSATGSATNLERAFRRALEGLGGAPVAAVVVVSDGAINQGASASDIARAARERGIAIHAVGIGDPTPPRNVQVRDIIAPENVFSRDPFALTGILSAQGLEGEQVRVALRELGETGGPRVVATKSVPVGRDGSMEPVVFEIRQERVGRFSYTLEAEAVSNEMITEDNHRQVVVRVIDSRMRVLLVAGGPSWDYRYITRLLERDATFDVSCWLQSADVSAVRDGNTVIDHLPTTAEELFAYDVILLMDPDGRELDETWCQLADRFVSQHGGGLLYVAARSHAPTFMRNRSLKPLIDMLPITPDPEADLVLNRIGHFQLSGSPVEVPEAAAGHPVLRLGDDSVGTRLAWRQVGEVFWHYPVLREKPVANVLLRHGDPGMRNAHGNHVLAAVQFVGAGRTGFLAFDSSWRWRRYGENHYNRFWIQLIRYLSEGKLLSGSLRAALLFENERPSLGESVTVSARLLDRELQPVMIDAVTVRYEVDQEQGAISLSRRGDRPGWFEGRFVPNRVGTYSFQLPIAGSEGEPQHLERELLVSRANFELLQPAMNKAALVTLGEESAGGRFWPVDEAATLPDAIPDLTEVIMVRSRPTPLWDHWLTLAILLTLLSVEWAMRKWNRLL